MGRARNMSQAGASLLRQRQAERTDAFTAVFGDTRGSGGDRGLTAAELDAAARSEGRFQARNSAGVLIAGAGEDFDLSLDPDRTLLVVAAHNPLTHAAAKWRYGVVHLVGAGERYFTEGGDEKINGERPQLAIYDPAYPHNLRHRPGLGIQCARFANLTNFAAFALIGRAVERPLYLHDGFFLGAEAYEIIMQWLDFLGVGF